MKLIGRKTVKGEKTSAPLSAKAPKASAKASAPKDEPTHEQIAKRAYELYLARGSQEGNHEDDWLMAEAELRHSA